MTDSFALETSDQFQVQTKFGAYKYELIYRPEQKEFVSKVKDVLLKKTNDLAHYFKYAPDTPIHITTDSKAITANGSATVFPTNVINLFNYPPTHFDNLSGSSNWIEILVVHELVHIIHMDQTRGILKYVRNIFGSVGKLGGIVPRWFTEGVATWAESHFTDAGRLRDPIISYELKTKLHQPGFCETIDCLDGPGQYPYGHFPYWVGAHFIHYLETKRPGSVACLIYQNSGTIPFNLNRAFNRCLSQDVWNLFKEFRASNTPKNPPFKDKDLYLQKGIHLKDKKLYYVSFKDDVGLLIEKDLKNNKLKEIRAPFKIDSLAIDSDHILVSTMPNSKDRVWYEYSKNFKELPISKKASYVFKNNQDYFSLKYDKGTWQLGKNDKTLYSFNNSLRFAKKIKDKIYFQLDNTITEFDLKNQKLKRWVTPLKSFNVLDYCPKSAIVRYTNKNLGIITPSNALESSNQNILLASTDNNQVFLLTDNKSTLTDCATLEKKVKRSIALTKPASQEKLPALASKSYPQLSHYIPRYWLFSYTGGGQYTDKWSIFTSAKDPLEKNSFDLSYNIYPGLSKTSPSLLYTHDFEDISLSLYYIKEYYNSSFSTEADFEKITGINLSYDKDLRNWTLISNLNANQSEVKDFLTTSSKKGYRFTFIQSFFKNPTHPDQFFNTLNLHLKPGYRVQQSFKDYASFESKFSLLLKPLSFLSLTLRNTYGKLYKTGLTDGVLLAGGEGSFGGESFHRFLALPYSDIYGNEIITNGAELDLELFDVYSAGGGLFPFILKS